MLTMRALAVTLCLLLVPAVAGAKRRGSSSAQFGDYTVGVGGGMTAQPVEPGSPDTLVSPALTGEFNLMSPIYLSLGAHGRVDAMGPAIGWDLALAGVIGGGGTLHGNGRTTADVFFGIPIPMGNDGWYLDLVFRGGPYTDDLEEGWGMAALEVKYSSWWDRYADRPRARRRPRADPERGPWTPPRPKDRPPVDGPKPPAKPRPKPVPPPAKRPH